MRFVRSESYFPLIIGVHLLLWALDLGLYEGPIALTADENPAQRVLGEVFSSWVITVFGFNLLMTTRLPWVQRVFGGLDKMYLIHRRSGMIAVLLLLLHFAVVPRHPDFTVGKPLGFLAMVLILAGVFISAAPIVKRRLSYSRWRLMHRLMGPAYLAGLVHALLVPSLIQKLVFIRFYVFGMGVLGLLSWFYTVFLAPRLRAKATYRISEAKAHGGWVTELSMVPVSTPLEFQAGQFAFFDFSSIEPRESHPFTIASAPGDENLRIAVRALGDYTRSMLERCKAGDEVEVTGPYGHLTEALRRSRKEVWVAGGIGITPFLARARSLRPNAPPVHLFWTVRHPGDALFDTELRDLSAQNNFQYTLWVSNDSGHLDLESIGGAEEVAQADIFVCGPERLRDQLIRELRQSGVPSRVIHTEEFAFR